MTRIDYPFTRYGLLVFVLLASSFYLAGQPTTQLDEAQKAIEAKDYPSAVAALESLVAAGYGSADVQYNLGLAYYRGGDLGHARLAWERGLKQRPHHSDLRHNLSVLLRDHPDGIQPLPVFFLSAWWLSVAGLLSPLVWTLLGLVLLWGGAAALAVYYLGKTSRRKSIIGPAVLVMALSLLPFLLALTRKEALENESRVVVLPGQAILHAAPDANSTEQATLHGGWKARLLDERDSWRKVRLEDGQEGYLLAEELAPI